MCFQFHIRQRSFHFYPICKQNAEILSKEKTDRHRRQVSKLFLNLCGSIISRSQHARSVPQLGGYQIAGIARNFQRVLLHHLTGWGQQAQKVPQQREPCCGTKERSS